VEDQTNVSNTLEKLKENMEEQTEIISSNEMKLTRIELEKKQKRDEQEQIEAQIKQLQKEKREKSELKRYLIDDIDRLSQVRIPFPSQIRPHIAWRAHFSYMWSGKLEFEHHDVLVTICQYHQLRIFLIPIFPSFLSATV
jgi:DNA gyrase/topoisomerase IV subunit A